MTNPNVNLPGFPNIENPETLPSFLKDRRPNQSDDSNRFYVESFQWIYFDGTNVEIFVCLDNTPGEAIWKPVDSTGVIISELGPDTTKNYSLGKLWIKNEEGEDPLLYANLSEISLEPNWILLSNSDSSGISEVFDDKSPTLGGNLTLNNREFEGKAFFDINSLDSGESGLTVDIDGVGSHNWPALRLVCDSNGPRKGFQCSNSTDVWAWASFEYEAGGTSTNTPGIQLGLGGSSSRDVNLYRAGNNTLRTDDTFEVGGDLVIEGEITGDITFNDDVIVQGTFTNEYYETYWAEEGSALSTTTSGGFQWSFGNGANTPLGGGLPTFVPAGYSAEVVALSLQTGGGGGTVELIRNFTATGRTVTLGSGGGRITTNITPYAIANGQSINFQTTATSGSPAGPCTVTAHIRFYRS